MNKVAATINEAAQITGLGRSSIYQLINDGKLTRRKYGSRTLILVEELEAFVKSLPVTEGEAA